MTEMKLTINANKIDTTNNFLRKAETILWLDFRTDNAGEVSQNEAEKEFLGALI